MPQLPLHSLGAQVVLGGGKLTNNFNERVDTACGCVSRKLRASVKPDTVEMLVLNRYLMQDALQAYASVELRGINADKCVTDGDTGQPLGSP